MASMYKEEDKPRDLAQGGRNHEGGVWGCGRDHGGYGDLVQGGRNHEGGMGM